MKRNFLLLFGVIGLVLLTVHCKGPKESQKRAYSSSELSKISAAIDSLDQLGLYRSAAPLTDNLMAAALSENNPELALQALQYQVKFSQHLDTDHEAQFWSMLSEPIEKASFPTRNLLAANAASQLWNYHNTNHWQLPQTAGDKTSSDIRDWSADQLKDSAAVFYERALHHPEKLQETNLDKLDALSVGDSAYCASRFNLFDLIAKEAISFYLNDLGAQNPLKLVIEEPVDLLSDNVRFLSLELRGDEKSQWKRAIELYQSSTNHHLDTKNEVGLAAMTVERLNTFYRLNSLNQQHKAYESALQSTQESLSTEEAKAEISLALAEFHEQRGNQYRGKVKDENRWHYVTAAEHCEKVLDTKDCPEMLCGPCEAMLSRIRQMELNVVNEKVILPGEQWRSVVNYRNISECYYVVVPFDFEEYRDVMSSGNRDEQTQKVVYGAQLRGLPNRLPLDDGGDLRSHSIEITHEHLAPGFYVLIAAPNRVVSFEKSTVSISPIWVSNIAWQKRTDSERKNVFRFVHRKTGEPLKNLEVELYDQQYNRYQKRVELSAGQKLSTDAKGMITVPRSKSDQRLQLRVQGMGEDYWLDYSFYQGTPPREQQSFTHMNFYTDRSVYRPGQTVFFKGIAVQHDGENKSLNTGITETVTLYDVNSQVIDRLKLTTNEYGSYEGSFTLPETGLTGAFRIESGRGSHYFNVEEYKRPVFRVDMEKIDSAYALGDEVVVSGTAKAMAGFAIKNATVRYRVSRTPEYFVWGRMGWPQPGASQEIAAGETTTDESGRFKVPFSAFAPETHQFAKEHYRFEVIADVVDISGESQQGNSAIRIGEYAFMIGSDLPQTVLQKDFDGVEVSAVNLNGEQVQASGTAKIYRLEMPENPLRERLWATPDQHQLDSAEFKKLFPLDPYFNLPGIETAETGQLVTTGEFDTSIGEKLELDGSEAWNTGWYMIRLSAEDSQGREVEYEHRFNWIGNKPDQKSTLPEFLWSHVSSERAQPGESVKVHISSAVKAVVLLEVEVAGEVTDRRELRIDAERVSLDIPVTEACRGNFGIHISTIVENRLYTESHKIEVPYVNKQLSVEMESFRDELQPGTTEEWTIKVSDNNGGPVDAEVLAGMYDASLDALGFENRWSLNPFTSRHLHLSWETRQGFQADGGWQHQMDWNDRVPYYHKTPCNLNFGVSPYFGRYENTSLHSALEDMRMGGLDAEQDQSLAAAKSAPQAQRDLPEPRPASPVAVRSNFNETAFFKPNLKTDSEGRSTFEFTLPESLTTWKWMLLAHSKSLQSGTASGTVVASKPLMIINNPPRFFCVGDTLWWSAQVVNQSDSVQSVVVDMNITEAMGEKDKTSDLVMSDISHSLQIQPGERRAVRWKIQSPDQTGLLSVTTTVRGVGHSDGERRMIPLLTNKTLVTETMPIALFGKGERAFGLPNLLSHHPKREREHQQLTLEFSANPTWYAVQALPYMMEFPHDCAEQIFSRFYANALAGHIVHSNSAIAEMMNRYSRESPETLWSNLQKNQELKQLLIEETPWLLDAQDETASKQRIALLFDLERMQREQKKAIAMLSETQLPSGAFPWFKGMSADRFITQYIVEGLARLQHLGVEAVDDDRIKEISEKALRFLSKSVVDTHEQKDSLKTETLSELDVQFLYLMSFSSERQKSSALKKAIEHIWQLSEDHWTEKGLRTQSMIAVAAYRENRHELCDKIRNSITERSIYDENKGRFWIMPSGYRWYQQPIETHSLLMELYADTEPGEQDNWVNEMKYWLLSQKRTQHWKTTTATANACYALLMTGDDWLETAEWPKIQVGHYNIVYREGPVSDYSKFVHPEPGTGHFKATWKPEEIDHRMGRVVVDNSNDSPVWGALYWQYFQDADRVLEQESGLKVDREAYVMYSVDGRTEQVSVDERNPAPGDRIVVRLIVESDQDMNYVHLSDRRAAGMEPFDTRSGYRSNGQVGYYLSVKDAAQHFFINYLPKGKMVLEYELRANLSGDFSAGNARVQCMYAPEFSGHSAGRRVRIEK